MRAGGRSPSCASGTSRCAASASISPTRGGRRFRCAPARRRAAAGHRARPASSATSRSCRSGARLDAVLQPKVAGAWLLHQHSGHFPLDFFILFSSIASAWGSREQAHYSEPLPRRARASSSRPGLPALSVNWGPWADGGMTFPEAEALLRRVGIRSLAADRALDVLNRLPDVPGRGRRYRPGAVPAPYEARGPRPLLDRVRVAKSAPGAPSMPALSDASPRERSACWRTASIARWPRCSATTRGRWIAISASSRWAWIR